MRSSLVGCVLIGLVGACKGSARAPDDAGGTAIAIAAVDAAVATIDAGPPPLVGVTITSLTTPAQVKADRFGARGANRPKPGQKLVVVTAQLAFSRCVDAPGDDSWKRKVKKGEDPGPEPRLIRIANIHGVLIVPGQDPIAATGEGASESDLMLSSYSEVAYPCDDPDHGRAAIVRAFLFAVPADTDLGAVFFAFRGARVPLPPPT